MAVKKVENKDAEQNKVKKTTTKKTTTKKTSGSKSTTASKTSKKATSTNKTTNKTTKRKKIAAESAVPELKERLSNIIPNAYGLDEFKDWVENMEEVVCKQIKVSVKSNVGKYCHNFQVKLYLRELAEKNGVALTDLQLFDDHFEFTLIQPIDQKPIKVEA